MTDHISELTDVAAQLKQNAFAAKLTFDERMAAYVVYKMGFPVGVLCTVFGVHKSTMNHMVNAHSRHYKKVRDTYKGLGHDAAAEKYLTPAIAARVKAAAESVPKTTQEAVKPADTPRAQANSNEGGPYTSGLGEEFFVRWFDEEKGYKGWYCVFGDDDPAGDSETGAPFNTSTEARKAGERM